MIIFYSNRIYANQIYSNTCKLAAIRSIRSIQIEYMRIHSNRIYANRGSIRSIWSIRIDLFEYIFVKFDRFIRFLRIYIRKNRINRIYSISNRLYSNIFDRNRPVHIRINSNIFAMRIYSILFEFYLNRRPCLKLNTSRPFWCQYYNKS